MTASKFDISSFRAEPPLPASNASARGDRAGDNAFADILRAQNTERDMPAAETRDEDVPRDDIPSSTDKPAPRQATKEKDAPAKPRENDSAKNDVSSTASDTSSKANDAAPDEQTKPKTTHDKSGKGGRDNAPAKDTATAQVESKSTDITALEAAAAAAAAAVPVVPTPVVIVATAVTAESAATTPVGKTAAPVAPVPAPTPDAGIPAGDKPAANSEMPQGEVASTNAAPVAPNTSNNDDAANFDQLVAAALRAVSPREHRKFNISDAAAPATPAKPTAPIAAPVAATPQAPTVNVPVVPAQATTPAAAAPAAAVPAAPNTNVDSATVATDDEAEAASLAALVKRPTAPRNVEPRPSAGTPVSVNTVPEPSLSDAEPIEAPAPRSGAGALTAATGLAAQVKGQELQNTPPQAVEMKVAASPEKAAAEAAATTAAKPDTASSVEGEAPNTPSTARTSEGQAPQPTHDSAVRGTSFSDALNAARGSRASANPLVAQVVVQVTKAVSDGNDRITIKLSPADLGRIDVRLDIGSDGKIQAVFAADKPQTVEMLQRDARELERALQEAGLRANSGSLSFNLRGEQQQRDGDASSFAGGRPGPGDVDALAEVPPATAQIYSATTAGNGRLDIHV